MNAPKGPRGRPSKKKAARTLMDAWLKITTELDALNPHQRKVFLALLKEFS